MEGGKQFDHSLRTGRGVASATAKLRGEWGKPRAPKQNRQLRFRAISTYDSFAHDRQREKCSFKRGVRSTGVKNVRKSFVLLSSSFTRYPVYCMYSQAIGPTNSNFNQNWRRKWYAQRLKKQQYWISLHPAMYNVHVVIFKIKSVLRFNQNFGCQGSKNVPSRSPGPSCSKAD